ncbi:MAG TPA: glycosyltransferase [Gemmatimonadales bacterium]|nr:glycosyltransferase [Gemmatimonadales bacterium]
MPLALEAPTHATWLYVGLPGAVAWAGVLLAPWRPWSTRERLDPAPGSPEAELDDITVLIPARNEAPLLDRTLRALAAQGRPLRAVVIDDQSTDDTAGVAATAGGSVVEVIRGAPLPSGWTGKLWALEQGRRHVATPLTLLLDADIELAPGIVAALLARKRRAEAQLVSVMATLRTDTLWERLLMPAFVFFFKLLYPFRVSNSRSRLVAAAAGGCILIETRVLADLGGFAALKDVLIDDCTLARLVKARGHRTWIGLSHGVRSLRRYGDLASIWDVVARSAFTQLRYSPLWLVGCTALLVAAFWSPLAALAWPDPRARWLGLTGLTTLLVSYAPTLRFYGRSPAWGLTLPLVGSLYLAMTWSSALRYWRGVRARWRGRTYPTGARRGGQT